MVNQSVRRREVVRRVLDRLLLVLIGGLLPAAAIVTYWVVSYHRLLVNGRWPAGAYRYDATAGYVLAPSFSGRLRDGSSLLRTHDLGFRIPEHEDSSELRPGGILSLGCSFTYGDEVDAEETFTFLLGQQLGLPSYNYGVCAYSYATMLLRLRRLAADGVLDRLQPRALILGTGDWLIERSLHPFMPSEELQYAYPYISANGDRLEIVAPPERFSVRHLFRFQAEYFPQGKRDVPLTVARALLLVREIPRVLWANFLGNRARRSFTERSPVSSAQLYEFVVSELKSILASRDLTVVVLWMATRPEQQMDPGLRAAAQRHSDVLLVDGGEALRRSRVHPDQYCCGRHPQPEAHAAYAQAIAATLREAWIRSTGPP